MCISSSFNKSKNMEEVQDCKSRSIIGASGSVLPQLLKSTQDQSSLQNFAWACLLLARKNYLLKENGLVPTEYEIDMPSLDHRELKKKKPISKAKYRSNRSDQRSNDCSLSGLHDDVALECIAWASRADYPSLSCLNKRFNSLIGCEDLYKKRRELRIIEYWVYLACTSMPWEAFVPSIRRWMRLPRMPCDVCFSNADKESLAVGTQLLVFGQEYAGSATGSATQSAVWMYSSVTRNWSRGPLMNLPRCMFGSGSSGEIAIVAGGTDETGRVLKCAELYNSDYHTWEPLPDMNLPRKSCSGFFMDGKFYVIGGMLNNTDSLTCGEEYNIQTRTWRRIENMYPGGNNAIQSPPLVAVVNNQLFAADQSMNTVKKYDKENNTWNVVKLLPVRADSSYGWGLAFKPCGDRLLVIGARRVRDGREVLVLHSWCPDDGSAGGAEWEVLSVNDRVGGFVHNCAIMGC
uniref:F-box domain-containing protein n=1 Tax=Ananas comosus var. bracteatus TaxID=296719 RepID=A0A6V7QXC9_ANACO